METRYDGTTYDVVVVGGGILGTAIAYWLSLLYEGRIAIIEKETTFGTHASGRNTGVIHRPFYLNPKKKRIFAEAAQASYELWRRYALQYALPWKEVGTLELALSEQDLPRLREYRAWARENGMRGGEVRLLSREEARALEPNIECEGALFARTDTAVDFGTCTKQLGEDAISLGVTAIRGANVTGVLRDHNGLRIALDDGSTIETPYLVNCAGGHALRLAQRIGLGQNFSTLNFRGDYWDVSASAQNLAAHNLYTLPAFPELPFLDPHWIVHHDGKVDVGPNAVFVPGPYVYDNVMKHLGGFAEGPFLQKLRFAMSRKFWSLAFHEWHSSFSAGAMSRRVRQFLPAFRNEYLTERRSGGIRSLLINRSGEALPETVVLQDDRSLHVLNYNSPGATGAPAYARHVVRRLALAGVLSSLRHRDKPGISPWTS